MESQLAPTIEWVNHASFILTCGASRIVCDPWLSGTAFNRGWRQISPSVHTPEDLGCLSHIWFSHQHPDHFAPSDIRKIPVEARRNIVTMYHHTIDKKVIRFCASLGFKNQIEMQNNQWITLGDGLSVQCGTWFDRDSWIAFKTSHGTILNINDCVVDSEALAEAISRRIGPVRVLLTQFSYADWQGNPDDHDLRIASAIDKLHRIATQVKVFQPEYVIPFASFVYWCSPENFHMNAEMNRADRVAAFIDEVLHKKPVVLYPGDRWTVGSDVSSWRSAERYGKDLDARIAEGPSEKPVSIPMETLEAQGRSFVRRMMKRNPLLSFRKPRPTVIYLTDHRAVVTLSLSGLAFTPSADPDIRMHSESLLFCLKMPWGSNALRVNGRFESVDARFKRFFAFFKAEDLADHGMTLSISKLPLLARAASSRFIHAIWRKVEHRKRGAEASLEAYVHCAGSEFRV